MKTDTLLGLFKSVPGTISSKRVCGVLGWVVLHIGFCYLCFSGKLDTEIIWAYVTGNTALLGIDVVFGKKNNTNSSENKDE